MTEQEIQQKIDDRKNAIRFIPAMYTNARTPTLYRDVNLVDFYANQTFDYLKREKGFVDAVRYTKELFKVKDTFKLERTSPFWNLYKEYLNLISELGNYKFMVRWSNSYGYNQNLTNEKILLYFTLFEDEMREIILFLANEYNKNNELQKDIENADDISYGLKRAREHLNISAEEYHQTWEDVNRNRKDWITAKELSYVKKEWRIQRNRACRTALNFIKWLEDLACKYNPEFKSNFKDYIEYLKNQPYYFCFIDDQQKKQLEEAKRLRKEQSRQV